MAEGDKGGVVPFLIRLASIVLLVCHYFVFFAYVAYVCDGDRVEYFFAAFERKCV